MVAPKLISGRKRKIFIKSFKPIVLLVTPEPPDEPPEPLAELPPPFTNPGGENCCVDTAPMEFVAPVLKRLIPKEFNFDLSTWAKRTFNNTCFCRRGSPRRMEFTMSLENGPPIFPI